MINDLLIIFKIRAFVAKNFSKQTQSWESNRALITPQFKSGTAKKGPIYCSIWIGRELQNSGSGHHDDQPMAMYYMDLLNLK